MSTCTPFLRAGLSALVILALAACSGDPRPLQEAVEANERDIASLVITSTRDVSNRDEPPAINRGESIKLDFEAFNSENVKIDLPKENRRWTISDTGAAKVTGKGLITGKSDGPAVVRVDLRIGGVVAAPAYVLVSSAVLDSLDNIAGPKSLIECSSSEDSYTATGTFTDATSRPLQDLEWRIEENQNGRLLDVTNTSTKVGALAPGSLTLTATSGGISGFLVIEVGAGLESLDIRPAEVEVERNATVSVTARANYLEGTAVATETNESTTKPSQSVTELVSWRIEDTSEIATVSDEPGSKGVVRGLDLGEATLIADCVNKNTTAQLTVTRPDDIVSLRVEPTDNPIRLFLDSSDTVQLSVFAESAKGSDEDVTELARWRVIEGEAVTVGNDDSFGSSGLVRAQAVGQARISVRYLDAVEEISVIVE